MLWSPRQRRRSKRQSFPIVRRCRATGEQPIALVGAGGISAAHLEAYARYGLNVVAICSRDLERARARRDAHFPNARVTDDFDTLLRDPNIRVLDLTAHADVRLDLMRRALNADKHVLSQKPFVENLDDGRELVELAERRGLKLAVNQNGRWAPHLAYIREAVRAGLIGEVTGVHVEIRWNHGWIAGTSFEAMDDRHFLGFRRPLVRLSRQRHRRSRAFRLCDDRSRRRTDRAAAALGSGADRL